jgi:hypothetical protein
MDLNSYIDIYIIAILWIVSKSFSPLASLLVVGILLVLIRVLLVLNREIWILVRNRIRLISLNRVLIIRLILLWLLVGIVRIIILISLGRVLLLVWIVILIS